ncbi:MAG: hypothetical protein ABJM02_14380 [Paracoccaceae bacterium]
MPFDEVSSLRLWHHLLIATVGSLDLAAARKAAPFAFGSTSYKGSAQQIYNDQLFFASPQPNQKKVLYGDEQPPPGILRREVGENAIGNALIWAIQIGEPEPTADFGGGYWELEWLAGADYANKLATSDALSPRNWRPLWGTWGRPANIEADYSALDDFFDRDSEVWGFWLRWFKAIHDGNPMPWELSRLIALELTAQDWQLGPGHVALKIKEIEALFRVRQSLSELSRQRLELTSQGRLGIGGNNPPEEIEIPFEVTESHTIIWAAVDEIAEQAEAVKPERSIVLAALEKLTRALSICLSWAAKKADLAVETAIKWSIPASGGYFLLNPGKFQALIEAVKAWSSFIP